MTPTTDPLEIVEMAGIALALAVGLAGLWLHAHARPIHRADAREAARDEADHQARWHRNAADLRAARLDKEVVVHRAALQVHGLLDGETVTPRLQIHRPEEGGRA